MPKGKGLRITREQWLKSIPIRITNEYYENEDGSTTILVEIEYKGFIGKLLKIFSITPPPKYKRIVLDRIGSIVWKMCDGKHSIEDIIKKLVKETGLSRRNIELAIYNYIKTLIMKGLIELKIPNE
jgi:hypothetical protein